MLRRIRPVSSRLRPASIGAPNKRGLYLATINAAAERLRALHETPPEGGTPLARFRNAIARHIAYMD
ncbi:MAG TPA: hypothetical protein VHJ17_21445, partial [Thermomonospora sp.]|nr:hypothetical protein [Thermomonospora sp.]